MPMVRIHSGAPYDDEAAPVMGAAFVMRAEKKSGLLMGRSFCIWSIGARFGGQASPFGRFYFVVISSSE
ncbi:MAG: hypothetical protein II324_05850 [Selenomonadales bacterium]|nr:hypothetical protein [Selenomonadales bacterium]